MASDDGELDESSLMLELIKTVKDCQTLRPSSIVGPSYNAMNKLLADLYLMEDNGDLKGIYHLTEAHAATLRQQTVIKYDYKEDLINNKKTSNGLPISQGLDKQYVSFDSEVAKQESAGLLSRLREMPKEWTIIQLTRQYVPEESYTIRSKDTVTRPCNLHITRLPCGSSLDEASPVTVLISMPPQSDGMPTLFDLISRATKEYLTLKNAQPRVVRKSRETGSQYIKDVVEELSSRVLKEWRCLLLGSLCNTQYAGQVRTCIDKVLNSDQHKSYHIMRDRNYHLLLSVTDAAVHLTDQEIQSAVCCLVECKELAVDLINAIKVFKKDMSILMAARRHPVLLILDEGLDCLPWEMLPILKKHPVSRVPSVHFLHALYHEHKDHIVGGCRMVSRLDLGFYVVNPDQDLKAMESRLISFLEKRVPEWKGVTGKTPSEDEFCSALVKNNIFLYCGHFNGTHILKADDIAAVRVVALPLLFGCKSVALQDLGGRAQPTGVSDKYLIAGSACVIGMLWTVTSDDTDCMTVMLLNSWLPGEPMDLKSFRHSGDMLTAHKEPELLRLLRHARDVAHLYSNAAALVARGIPIRIKEE